MILLKQNKTKQNKKTKPNIYIACCLVLCASVCVCLWVCVFVCWLKCTYMHWHTYGIFGEKIINFESCFIPSTLRLGLSVFACVCFCMSGLWGSGWLWLSHIHRKTKFTGIFCHYMQLFIRIQISNSKIEQLELMWQSMTFLPNKIYFYQI